MSLSSSGEPLTRRQLRELERAQEAAEVAATTGQPLLQPPAAPDAPQLLTSPIAVVSPEVAATLPEHPLTRRELRALLQARDATAVAPAPVATAEPVVQSAAPAHELVADRAAPAAATEPARPVLPAAEQPVAPASGRRAAAAESRLFQPPTGHWSIGATGAVDQVQKADDASHSRSLESSGASTSSNALIIPSVPSIADITAPLTATGEILVTGSIDLPRALGATGQLPNRFDGAELDKLFDQPDAAVAPADSAPVAATRAISTHVPSRNVIAPPKQQSARVPTVLAITAGVIAVAVAGLFAAGFIFHLF